MLRPVPTEAEATTGPADGPAVEHVTIHGYRRAFRRCGSGPALVLLHGIGDSSESWAPLLPALGRDFTVLAPDLLGHGASDKPRADYSVAAYANGVRDLLDVLGIDRATVVGHSLGGGVAAQTAYQYPHRVERLVLVSSGGVAREVSPFLRLLSAPYAELTLPLTQVPGARLVGRGVAEVAKRTPLALGRDADDLLRVFDGLPSGPARKSFTRTLRSVVDWRGQLVTMLDRCYLAGDMPSLLVWGDRDGVIPVAHGHRAHEAMPGSRLEVFAGAGHFPHHAEPQRFLDLLTDFVAGTEPAAFDADIWSERLRTGRAAAGPTGAAPAASA
ncbi:alpha/beta fold hydrolase [Iamia majanohamensis]|uniref:Alpha/beta fold hydrolase n=1 Tax=Iamia majanohamensis TaxID=467976 RepID=A0AAF0BR56_9ACTN|nr:alpha/beta fold hydrolase [Iamia majanohamensis]WCO66051.1 alpha/beta fold hydrolase [Iamia majanohamensis]